MALIWQWLAGLLVAVAGVGLSAQFFLSPIPCWEFDEQLGVYVRVPNSVQIHAKEGWARSHYGKHGIIGIPDVTAVTGTKICIWGDSFVEGYQVDDAEKLPQQVTQQWRENYKRDCLGVGIAESGWSVGNYLAVLSVYEKLLSPSGHVFVCADLADFSPDGRLFKQTPKYSISSPPVEKKFLGARNAMQKVRANFLFMPLLSFATETLPRLRFCPGKVQAKDDRT